MKEHQMSDLSKSNQKLQEENRKLRERIHKLEQIEIKHKIAEDKLKESEARFKAFMDSSPEIAWIKDEEGRHVYLSKTYEKRFGVSLDDWRGKTDFELWPLETAEEFRKNDLLVLQNGKGINIIEETKEPDGSVAYWLNFKFLIIDASGRRYVGGFGVDITSHKRVERELSETLQRLHFHMENTPLAEVEFDKYYRVTYWSKQAENIFGWTSNEIIGRSIDQMRWVHEDDVQRVSDLMTDMLASRRTSNTHTNRNYRKDGSVITCEWYNSALLDDTGELVSVHSQVQDITERKQMEDALQKSEAKYRLLHQSMRDAFAQVDLDGSIKEFNEAYVEMLGYTPDELKHLNYHDITPRKWHALEAEILEKQVFPRGYSDTYEKEYRRKDGTVFPIELRIFLLRSDTGEPAGMWAIIRNITERKQVEKDREKLIGELQRALKNVKTLSGLLPICASCKKIRDDKGYWNQIESYIRDHSQAEFSHGICPECLKKLYPDIYEDTETDKND